MGSSHLNVYIDPSCYFIYPVAIVVQNRTEVDKIRYIFQMMESKGQTTAKISLTFIRHGQSEGNQNGLIQGQGNTSLSEQGKNQSELAGLALSQVSFDKMYSSDQDRAYDTATIIASKNESLSSLTEDENHNIVEANELLRERSFGIFDLRPHKEFKAKAEESGYGKNKNLYDFIPEGGEGLPDVKKRAAKFLDYIFQSVTKNELYHNKTCSILVSSHSGFLRQMSIYLLKDCRTKVPVIFETPSGENLDNFLERAWKNTAFSVFEIQVDTQTNELISIKCIKYASVDHLDQDIKNKCNY